MKRTVVSETHVLNQIVPKLEQEKVGLRFKYYQPAEE
jgi:hypothetical protein